MATMTLAAGHERAFAPSMSVGGALSDGWYVLRVAYAPLALLSLGVIGASLVLGMVPFGGLLTLAAWPILAGATLASARCAGSGVFEWRLYFDAFNSLRWLEMLLVGMLAQLATTLVAMPFIALGALSVVMGLQGSAAGQAVGWAMGSGLILVGVVASAWVQARIMFAHIACFEVPKDVFDVAEPFRISWRLTRPHSLQLFGLSIVLQLVSIASMLLLCVGFVVFGMPFAIATTGAAYRLVRGNLPIGAGEELDRCPTCEYDMAGIDGATCPECGRVHKGRVSQG